MKKVFFNRWKMLITLWLLAAGLLSAFAWADEAQRLSKRLPLEKLEPHYRTSVLRGWNTFHTSHSEDGVACVDCHLSHRDIALWAKAYPKVHVFDGTVYRVKTLHRTVLEAFEKHTDLSAEAYNILAGDVVSYISWWGFGRKVTPGYSESHRPARRDLLKLENSVDRGKIKFHAQPYACARCHVTDKSSFVDQEKIFVGHSFTIFPRYQKAFGKVVSLEGFLRNHLVSKCGFDRVDEKEKALTDLVAYLASLCEGRIFIPGTRKNMEISKGGVHEN